jgi:GntR family transcriptional repressor for pyruvate dehydrogenase complex
MATHDKHDHMTKQIERIILARRLKPGGKLPSERELQVKYGVGRGTVREALRSLQQQGLIEIKKGARGGAFAKEIDSEGVSETLAALIRHRRVSVGHLAEFREVIEPTTAAFAAERATAEDIEKLKKLLEEGKPLAESEKGNHQKFYAWELNMHNELGRISGNPLFEWISRTQYLNLQPFSSLLYGDKALHLEALEDWENIIEAIEKGEVMRVYSIVRTHVVNFRRLMAKVAKRQTGDES